MEERERGRKGGEGKKGEGGEREWGEGGVEREKTQ